MSKLVKLSNGNIIYMVDEKEHIMITLNFEVITLTIGEEYIDFDKQSDPFTLTLALYDYIKGKKGVEEDRAIENVMECLTQEAYKWLRSNGLEGLVVKHTLVKPNEWVDDFVLTSNVKFYTDEFTKNNYAKIKNMNVYQEILDDRNHRMYTINVDMVLPIS